MKKGNAKGTIFLVLVTLALGITSALFITSPVEASSGVCFDCKIVGEFWSCQPVREDAGSRCYVSEEGCTLTGVCHIVP